MRVIISLLAALALSACGPSGGGGAAALGETCALVAEGVLATPVEVEEMAPLEDADGECRWVSQEGLVHAQIISFTDAPDTKFDETVAAWAAQSLEAPIPLEGVGDRAMLVREMQGGQAQAIVQSGARLVLILAVSGDEARNSEATARAIAASVAANLAGARNG